MTDTFTKELRSRVMRSVKSKNTKPELTVRRLLHKAGYRYRLHRKDLPGNPDIVFPSRKKVIWIHGCFWHQHEGCKAAERPQTNQEYWEAKFTRTLARDSRNIQSILALGWNAIIIWECELGDSEKLLSKLVDFLEEW